MTPEKWKNIINNIKDNLEFIDEGNDHIEEEGGIDIEFIEFKGPMGKMRLEFISKPVVLGKKTIYSRRIGSETNIEYVYSKDEKINKLIIYKWDEDLKEWIEIDPKDFKLE